MANRTAVLRAGALVGGGSAVNSMFFYRESAEDYDNWEKLGNPGWGGRGCCLIFGSVTFTPPSLELQTYFNVTYNVDAYGQNGSVHSSFPPFIWPTTIMHPFTSFTISFSHLTVALMKGWNNYGITTQQEGASGHAYNLIWVPASLDPKSLTRSYSRTTHYETFIQRPNYYLLTVFHADKICFSENLNAEGVEIQARDASNSSQEIITVRVRKEAILAAGAIGIPLLLQRSGVSPAKLLQEAGIDVKAHLPCVGQNLQDHSVLPIGMNFTGAGPISSKTILAANATFLAEALIEYLQTRD